ncbi:hypothetical protein BGP_0339 [Beggiatoa sp. PS]|nr:hypothetical protein BGP_0339 [Beggiatoa sp. PS]
MISEKIILLPERLVPEPVEGPNHVEGKFLQLPSTCSGNGIIFSGNHLKLQLNFLESKADVIKLLKNYERSTSNNFRQYSPLFGT